MLFAAERTLLAWQRSAIALMGFGLVVERLGLLLDVAARTPDGMHRNGSLALGVYLIAIGGGVSVTSTRQFSLVLRAMDQAAIPAGYSPSPALGVGASLLITAAALLAFVLFGT